MGKSARVLSDTYFVELKLHCHGENDEIGAGQPTRAQRAKSSGRKKRGKRFPLKPYRKLQVFFMDLYIRTHPKKLSAHAYTRERAHARAHSLKAVGYFILLNW